MARRNRAARFKRSLNPVTWLLRHAQMSLSSLGRLSRNPISTAMTTAVVGIALALPGGLHLLVGNVSELGGSWEGSASISLFLSHGVSDEQADTVRQQIALRDDISEARLIDRHQALEEFRRLSGFGEAIDLLDQNPLPAVVLVQVDRQRPLCPELQEVIHDLGLPRPGRVRGDGEASGSGVIVDPVASSADPDVTYALYLPADFTPEGRWPVLLIMDPRGRALVPLELFRPAAERLGWGMFLDVRTGSASFEARLPLFGSSAAMKSLAGCAADGN